MDAVPACGCLLSRGPAEKQDAHRSVTDSIDTSKLSVIGRELANTGHTDTIKYDKSGVSGLGKL